MPSEFFGSPTAAQLTEAVREFLVSLTGDIPPERAFHLRVAVNALRIVEQELTVAAGAEAGHHDRMAALGVTGDRDLARSIRAGEFPQARRESSCRRPRRRRGSPAGQQPRIHRALRGRPVTRLEGRTAVVTGGNAGLGLGMALGIGQAGAAVVIWARDHARNERAVAELAAAGIDARAFPCDVSEPADVSRAMAGTLSEVDAVDCLVANAGIAAAAPFLDTSLAEWRRVLSTNLDGTFLTTQAVARHMVARGHGGSIIIVSSLASRSGGGRRPPTPRPRRA